MQTIIIIIYGIIVAYLWYLFDVRLTLRIGKSIRFHIGKSE